MGKVIIFIILGCFFNPLLAQSADSLEIYQNHKKVLDSLLFKVLPGVDRNDPHRKIEICNESEKYILNGLENYQTFIFRNKAFLYEEIGEPEKALFYIDKSYDLALNSNDMIAAARSLQFKAIYYGKRNELLKSEEYIYESTKLVEENLYTSVADSTKNKNFLLNLKSNLTLNYTLQQKYDKAIPLAFSTLDLAKLMGNKKIEALTYSYIGESYKELGQDEKALEYYIKENQLAIELKDARTEAYSYGHIASTLDDIKNQKEVLANYNKALLIFEELKNVDGIIKVKHNIFKTHRLNGAYKKCLEMAPEIIDLSEKSKYDLSKFYIELGEIATKLKNFKSAEEYFILAEKLLDEKQLSKVYFNRKKADLEKERGNLQKALELKVEEFDQTKQALNSSVVESLAYHETKLKVSEKEKQILEGQSQIIKEIGFRNNIVLISGILFVLAMLFFFIYNSRNIRKDLKMKKVLEDLKLDITTMELYSLNKQLDPHEIKNLLATISPEIQEKAPESYKQMLRLLNITKASLNNNSLTESVGNQIKQIEDFLSLKKSSLFEPLEYHIENKIKNQEHPLPRLILKNLVENSVKHGIKGKEGGGEIIVSIEEMNNVIVINVNDTGKGRKNAISLDSGIGTTTYQKLFTTLNQKNNESASFTIMDKVVGTLVEVKIPMNYKYN